VGFGMVIVLIVLGTPIALAFGALAVLMTVWFNADPSYLVPTVFIKIRSVVLLAGPLFILLGNVMDASGLATKLINFVNSVVGQIKSGLGTITVATTAVFGSISGTDSAAIACIGTIMIPRMQDQGYPRGHATALVACAGILGQLVPPSVPMIFYAIVSGNSIPACWAATVGPAIVMVIYYSILNAYSVRKIPLKVSTETYSPKQRVKLTAVATYKALPVLFLPVIVLGGIYGGIVTPTEGACLGVAYTILVALAYRTVGLKTIWNSAISAAVISGVILFMTFFILITSKILVVEGITRQLAEFVMAASPNIYVTLLLLNVILLAMGMMMDDLSGTLLAAAVLYPVAVAAGVHPLHFAAIVGVNLGLGTVTPPTAPMLFLAGRIGNSPPEEYMKPAMFFMWVGMLPLVIITTYWPGLSLFIPGLLGFVH
ncbi:MAG: TRAP transporter large permease, partial [Chloroflexi bacterium]|nr:TRAP transporter large permease [Chloroflexota bacterium]